MSNTRRIFLKQLGSGVLGVSLSALAGTHTVLAADRPKVDPADATAQALGYVETAPTAAKKCAGCQLYKGSASSEYGPCGIFPGKLVKASGWCSSWSA